MNSLLLPTGGRVSAKQDNISQGLSPRLATPRLGLSTRQSKVAVRADTEGVYDVVAAARSKMADVAVRQTTHKPPQNDFVTKLKAAWRIFFPPKPEQLSPKEAGKSRLRMILVADRCGMNQASMYEMRHSIVRAVSNFVEIEAEDLVEVNVTSEPEMGTVYCVAVPVRRVKPQARMPMSAEEPDSDGITLMWDSEDGESDPSERFPYGC